MDISNKLHESVKVNSWRSHIRGTILLGLPLICAQLAQTALNVTNTIVLGRLGPMELGASVLGWQLFYVIWMFGSGFGFAVMPLVANTIGARDLRGGRRFVRMGLWISFAYAVLLMLPLWNAERIFLALGQDSHISALAAQYIRTLQWSLFPQLAIIVLRSFLGAMERPGIIVLALAIGGTVNVLLNIPLVFGGFGLSPLGMAGAGLSTVIATSCVAVFLIGYINWHPLLRTHEIFVRFLRPDITALGDVFRLGWPIGITVVAEVALFTATSFMMGWVGSMDLAAHGIAVQLSGLAFMIPLGLSAAVTVRVGIACGAGNRQSVARAATTGITMGVGIACLSALIFVSFPRQLVGLYLDLDTTAAAEVLPYAFAFLAVAGVFQIVDSIQALSNGSLRGLRDTRIPMIIAVVSYWCVGVPVGYWLTFQMGWGGVGIWWGLAIGLATAATLLTGRLIWRIKRLPSDWSDGETR